MIVERLYMPYILISMHPIMHISCFITSMLIFVLYGHKEFKLSVEELKKSGDID
jgi:hypothetical protein